MNFRRILGILLSFLLGGSYILSGFLKLLPVEYLENDILQSGLGNEWTVPFQARLLIGLEFAVGALIICQLYLVKTLRFSLWMLGFYSLYLAYVIIRFGNEGNCGCYGQQITMSPLQGILKNVVIALATILLLKYRFSTRSLKSGGRIAAFSMMIVSIALPFILYKIDFPEKTIINGQEAIKVDLDILYNTPDTEPLPFEIRKGKVMVAFMTLSCVHCRMAANKLELIKRQHPELPLYFVLNGKKETLDDFLKMTEVKETPYAFFNTGDELVKITGTSFPAIMLLQDSYAVARLDYLELNAENIMSWYHTK